MFFVRARKYTHCLKVLKAVLYILEELSGLYGIDYKKNVDIIYNSTE